MAEPVSKQHASQAQQNTKLWKLTFKDGQRQSWIDWCAELRKRADEVEASLKAEGVTIEACFISEIENACYYLMQAHDFETSKDVSNNSGRVIDVEHRSRRLAALDFVEELAPVFYFDESQWSTPVIDQ